MLYHKHWFLKCQLKENQERLEEHSQAFQCSLCRESIHALPSLVCWPGEQTTLGVPQGNLLFYCWQSLRHLLQNPGKGEEMPSVKGNTCVVSAHRSDPDLLGRYFRSGSGTRFWGERDRRKGLSGTCKAFTQEHQGEVPPVTLTLPRGNEARNWHSCLVTTRGSARGQSQCTDDALLGKMDTGTSLRSSG